MSSNKSVIVVFGFPEVNGNYTALSPLVRDSHCRTACLVLGPVLGLEPPVLGPCLEIHVLKQVIHCGAWFSKSQWQLHAAFPVSQG